MSELVVRVSVHPFYHQVVVRSADATDVPVPETGLEAVVASTEWVTVATRSERAGDVVIEVRRGPADDLQGARVFDGELSFTTPLLEVGSAVAEDLATVDVGRIGWIPIEIYTDPPDAPSNVVVVIPESSARRS